MALFTEGPFIYYFSKRTGWVQKMAISAEVQDYCIYAGWVGGFEKVQKFAKVIYGWFLT